MNWEQLIKEYYPKKNHLDNNASFDGFMFETFGKEIEYVKAHMRKQIWTIINEDNKFYIIPDFHVVNRIGYIICENLWGNEDLIIKLDD